MTLIELKEAHYGDVQLDDVTVMVVYRGGTWIKFYISDNATVEQTDAAVKLLPTFEGFFAIDSVLEVKNVPISIEHAGDTMRVSTPNTSVEIEAMRGKNGEPISIDNLPWPGFPAPPLNEHTQYKTIVLKHDGGDQQFDHKGTNGFTATIQVDAVVGH